MTHGHDQSDTQNTAAWWNETWSTMGPVSANPDELLAAEVEHMASGLALDIGCGEGANAVWLAEQGWRVTAVDYAESAIRRGRGLAAERGVEVEFVVADATSYVPDGRFDLITLFYIQLPAETRKRVLETAARYLAPGGLLLFAGHDRSEPPHQWKDEDRSTLTTPEQVASELPGLTVRRATVISDEPSAHASSDQHDSEGGHGLDGATTLVLAVRPGGPAASRERPG